MKKHQFRSEEIQTILVFLLSILFSLDTLAQGSPDVRDIAPDGAWNWSMDERAVFSNGYLFVGYAKRNGQVGLTRYDPNNNTGTETIISTTASAQRDDHVAPSITILSDGRLLAMHTRHLGNEFFYRISNNATPGSISDWSSEYKWDLPTTNLFSNTYSLSGENNAIYNFYRGINDNPTVSISRDEGLTWENQIQLIRTTGSGLQRPYPKFATDEVSRIDFTYTDGHPRVSTNSIYHLYYENGIFRNSDGSFFKNFQDLPIQHDGGERGTYVYQYSTSPWGAGEGPNDWIPNGRAWTWDTAYYTDGRPMTVFQVSLDDPGNSSYLATRIFYYYARWTGTEWQKVMIAKAGRPLYASEEDYSGGIAVDPDNPNVVYISSNAANPFDLTWQGTNIPLNANDRYEIWKGVTSDGGLTFSWQPITQNSAADHLRPIVPKNHGQDQHAIWFNGDYTSYEGGWNSKIVGLFGNSTTVPVNGITVTPSGAALTVGESTSLTATVSPANATETSVAWSTSNPGVATVNTNGTVTAIGAGTATITATTNDGSFSDTATITVQTATVPVTGVTVTPSGADLTVGDNASLTATVSPANATDTSVAWSTSNPGVATVSTDGTVTAIGAGTTTITATTNDSSFTDTATITVQTATVPVTGVTVTPSG
ncbi:Ig-like domain-containing protein, partial [Maribacter flavus]|uniref:Ig-like domain-containing protein n=1 Tax=Maribacter flavus TaxID=1658664 RepID=UPI001B861A90